MLGASIIAISESFKLDVVGRAPTDGQRPVAHRSSFRKARRHSGTKPHEGGVVAHLTRIHFRGAHIIKVLGDNRAEHGAGAQRAPQPGRFTPLGAGEHPRDSINIRGREKFTGQGHLSRVRHEILRQIVLLQLLVGQ